MWWIRRLVFLNEYAKKKDLKLMNTKYAPAWLKRKEGTTETNEPFVFIT